MELGTGYKHDGPVGEPSPAANAFIRLAQEFQLEHPEIIGVPLEVQSELWARAGIQEGNFELARGFISELKQTNSDKAAALSELLEQAEIVKRISIQ